MGKKKVMVDNYTESSDSGIDTSYSTTPAKANAKGARSPSPSESEGQAKKKARKRGTSKKIDAEDSEKENEGVDLKGFKFEKKKVKKEAKGNSKNDKVVKVPLMPKEETKAPKKILKKNEKGKIKKTTKKSEEIENSSASESLSEIENGIREFLEEEKVEKRNSRQRAKSGNKIEPEKSSNNKKSKAIKKETSSKKNKTKSTDKKSGKNKSTGKKKKSDESSFSEFSANDSEDASEDEPTESEASVDDYSTDSKPKHKAKNPPKSNKTAKSNSKKATTPKDKKTKSTKRTSSGGSKNQVNEDDEKDMFEDEGFANPSIQFKMPYFLEPENIKDKEGRRPSDPNYDPTTLFIPKDYYEKQQNMVKQFWDCKRVNNEKLIGLNVWDHYLFFFTDALVIHKLLDFKISVKADGRFLCYVPNRFFRQKAPIILEAGYQILLAERVSDRMEVFQKKQNNTKQHDLVRREPVQVLTRGTYIDHNELDFSSRYALCIFEYKLKFGLVFLDATTQEFHIGEFEDDEHRTHFRTIMTRIKPIEVIFYNEYISEDALNIVKNLSTKPAKTPLTLLKPKELEVIFTNIERNRKEIPETIQSLIDHARKDIKSGKLRNMENASNFITFQALNLCMDYLEDIMLMHTVFAMGDFHLFDKTIEKQGSLYLDSQALENLEVLEVGYINLLSESHSLFGFMDKTSTPFGKRMFKRWVTAPLLDPAHIQARMDCVEDLLKYPQAIDIFQEKMKKLPDLERWVNRIYNLTDKKRLAALHVEDFAFNRLKDFRSFLPELKRVEEIMESLQSYLPKFKSQRLKQLMTIRDIDISSFNKKTSNSVKGDNNGLFPRIKHIVEDLEAMVTIEDTMLIPAPGICKGMDVVMEKTRVVKAKLEKILQEQRKLFKSNDIVFVTSRRRYEMEFPEQLIDHNKRPKDYIITSKRKGFLRYQTPEIEELVESLIPLDFEFQREIVPFIVDYFTKFYERRAYWKQIITCLSEIDCLCSLAKFSQTLPKKCKPKILPMSDPMQFDLKNMVHPMAAKLNPNFVPNSILLSEPIFLITGPNMGGKSTFLRMVCLAVVMAQMGSYVPADSFTFTAMDRIFTRVGASDRITEGKSTFFVEMEETYNIVTQATKNSLVILDELGRGTSTYDGVSIAYGTLKYIAEKLNCMTLFATHYHFLIEEFSVFSNIRTYFMLSEFDEKSEEVKFRYKFVPGKADRSHGIVMGKMAGLPIDVLERAKEKEKFMTQEKRNIGFEKNLMEKFGKAILELHNFEASNLSTKKIDNLLLELGHLV